MRTSGWQLAQGVAAAVVLARLARGRRRRPPLAASAPGTSVSVVVPARDEAGRIGPCLAALARDADLLEVLVVDDRSADATAAVAAAAGARVVAGAALPAGWAGKAWALQQGLEAARGDVVVLLDADARAAPGLAGALAAMVEQRGRRTIVSAGPRYACASAGERAVHPALLATLVYRFGPTDVEGFAPRASRALLNGQCVAARRSELLAAGGLGRVRGSLVEDVALARSLAADGWRVGFTAAPGLLEVEGYGSARAALEGWGRSIATSEATPALWQAADLAVVWLTLALPLPRLLARRGTVLDAALLALRVALLAGLRDTYRPRGAAFWCSPLADVPVALAFARSALRPSRAWRGRTY